jgi:hypothetical protein
MRNKMDEMKKSIEVVFLYKIPKRDMEIQEMMKIRKTMVLRLNHISGSILSQYE